MVKTPVVIIIYNRPDHTKELLSVLRKVQPEKLYVIGDGPKAQQTKENGRRIASCRALIDTIDWPCQIVKDYAAENLGCDKRIRSGLDKVFASEEMAIVLEDDCIPSESFFYYCEELLEHYAVCEQVAYISGTNPCPISDAKASFAFTRRGDTWGWATWRRVWQQVPEDFAAYFAKLQEEGSLAKVMGARRAESFIREVEAAGLHGEYPWDYQMLTSVFARGQLSIVPRDNLVKNIGFTSDSTHTSTAPEGYGGSACELSFPLVYPSAVYADGAYDRAKNQLIYLNDTKARLLRKGKREIKKLSRKIKKVYVKTAQGVISPLLKKDYRLPLENVGGTDYQRNCLLMYQRRPFESSVDMSSHQNQVQSLELVKVLGSLSMNVDVINYNEAKVRFSKRYDLVIDMLGGSNTVYEGHLMPGAKRVAYLTTSNPKVNNERDKAWIMELQQRRGAALPMSRSMTLLSEHIADYDGVLLFGNEETLSTYEDEKLPQTYLLPNTGYETLVDEAKEYLLAGGKPDPASFLFFASSGQVHKGLDRLLDIFDEKDFPCTLYVCGNYEKETAFVELYREQLYNRDNIIPMGHVDIFGEEFRELSRKCTYMISPSCAEGMSGAVLTTMSAAMIPLCSKYCGFSSEEVCLLEDLSVEGLRRAVLEYAGKDKSWIQQKREAALQVVRDKYTLSHFSAAVKKGLQEILGES